ncbi:uncharacterized protein NPIL_410081 [Nephila pilipes]|uniref:Uncharacterized protein n=1 Tax=Nephila pilipes TaxID=299642 RepID=A0A8X6NDQ0_NEPPI|nr:uncharacterized protein NPIL_410081 [Nephila pilipes]
MSAKVDGEVLKIADEDKRGIGVDKDMNIIQVLASLHSMHGTVTREDILNELKKAFADYGLDWTNLICLTVDGGKNTSGIKKGLI